jgi:hypothetical protein
MHDYQARPRCSECGRLPPSRGARWSASHRRRLAMQTNSDPASPTQNRVPWNKGKLTGTKPLLRPQTRLGNSR